MFFTLYQGCDMGTRHENRDSYGLVLDGKFGWVLLWYGYPTALVS